MGEIHDPVYVVVDGKIICQICGYPGPSNAEIQNSQKEQA